MAKKAGLGKGMKALMDDYGLGGLDDLSAEEQKEKLEETFGKITELPVDNVVPNRYQPRKHFDEEKLTELAESIAQMGVIAPIIVSAIGDGNYELVAGERRLRASKMAGKETIPAVLGEFSAEERMEIALIENLQREDLNAMEVAEAYQEIMNSQGLSQGELANRIGKSRTAVANTLRLLKLPEAIREKIAEGVLSEGHARAILASGDLENQLTLARWIESEGLSVRESERRAKELLNRKSPIEKERSIRKDGEIRQIEEKLIRALGIKVEVKGDLKKGKIQLSYFNTDELQALFDRLSKEN